MNDNNIYNEIFIDNKYTRYYFLIIKNSKGKISKHKESHHIIPRSLGGSDDQNNIVDLTPREHFICHALLTKMLVKYSPNWHKMIKAITMFKMSPCKKYNRYINSRIYESLRNDISIAMSISQTGNKNSQYGTKWINNPITKKDSKIKSTDIIPEGWIEGRYSHSKDKREIAKINNTNKKLDDRLIECKIYYDLYIQGLSTREIAKIVGKSHVTAYKNIQFYKKEKGII